MPIKLSGMAADRANASFEYADSDGPQTVHITFYARRVTAGMLDQLAYFTDLDGMSAEEKAQAGPAAVVAVAEMLAALLIAWDVLDDEGRPLPTTREVIDALPFDFLIAVLEAVMQQFRLGESKPTGQLPRKAALRHTRGSGGISSKTGK